MKWLSEIFNSLQEIQSFIGLVSAGLFLVVLAIWVIYKRTRPSLAKDTPDLLKYVFKGVIGLSALLIVLYFSLIVLERTGYFVNKKPTVSIFDKRIHLGDNIFSRVGGKSLPTQDAPSNLFDSGIIRFDKESGIFKTNFGLPTHVQMIAGYYGKIFDKYNLKAWKNISEISLFPKYQLTYEGSTVKIDAYTTLIWVPNALHNGNHNFYDREAAIGITITKNIYKELKRINYSPEGRRLESVKFYFSGLHGSKRPEQPDNVELVVNQEVYKVPFKSLLTRNEEVVSILIKPSSISLEPEQPTMFTLVVLPFQEKYPIPPPEQKDRRGPAHFRDIEIGECYIELQFAKT